jgi:anaerobic magnesium-protoporphyrin IX monomethyl ester cyclase
MPEWTARFRPGTWYLFRQQGGVLLSRVLLVNPPSAVRLYENSRVKVGISTAPFIALASVAGALLEQGHSVLVADLMIEQDATGAFRSALRNASPDLVGITFTTPLYSDAKRLARIACETLPETVLIAGNVHATSFPEDALRNGFDLVVLGEGERMAQEIASGKPWRDIPGVAFLEDGGFVSTGRRPLIDDLDDLPLPAWQLYDLGRYRAPHIAARLNPVGYMETSRAATTVATIAARRYSGTGSGSSRLSASLRR